MNNHVKLKMLALVALFLFFGAINSVAQEKGISIQVKNASLKEVFNAIEKQTSYRFSYRNVVIDSLKNITISKTNAAVSVILDEVLGKRNLTYSIVSPKSIVVSDKQVSETKEAEVPRKYVGIITDEIGEPVIGVNIAVKGSQTGTVTDIDGKFSLEALAGSVLLISYIGYAPMEIRLENTEVIDLQLKKSMQNLSEVIVVGYGTNSMRNLTSAISTIDANKMAAAPVANITDALAGRTAGLIVTQSGGGIGKTSSVSIRGGGTPLVVIDGFIVPYSDFQNINMNDIESMSVLKDASATAVYGARAGDGIIVIKTKSGTRGIHVDYTYGSHFSQPSFSPKKFNSWESAMLSNDIRKMYGLEPLWTDEEIEKFRTGSDPYNYPNTDWKKELLKDYAPETKHAFTLRGGSDFSRYFVSFQAYNQQSLYTENSHWLKRYNMTMNQTSEFKNIGLKLNFEVNGYIVNQRNPQDSYNHVFEAYMYASPREAARNKYGQLYSSAGNSLLNMIALDGGYTKYDQKVITGIYNAEWQVYGVEGLSLKASGNYRYEDYYTKTWNRLADEYDLEGNKRPIPPPSLSYKSQSDRQYTVQFFADYKRSFLDVHNVAATFGYEVNSTFGQIVETQRKNYVFLIDQMDAGPSDSMENSASEAESGRAGFIGRLAYNFNQKYYIEGSLRHDGSDLFPKDRRWGTFYAGSLGYAISEESFFQTIREKNILNFLKLRASYGQTGLDSGVERFSYLTSYDLNERGYVVGGTIVPTFSEGALVSNDITWYTGNTTDAGIDFSSLDSRLSGSLDYFFVKTTGYLTSPSSVAYSDPLGLSLPTIKSNGEHRREGFEIALSWKDKVGDFKYEIGGNFTYFDQLIAVAYDEDLASQKNPFRRQVQQRGYYGIGLVNLGYYQNADDVMNSPRRSQSFDLVAGDIKYLDTNGDGYIDDSDQRRFGKNGTPRGNYGIFTNLEYKGFFVNLLFQGATSRDMMIFGHMMGMLGGNTGQTTTYYDFQLNYWRPDNRNSLYPRIGINSQSMNGNNNYQTSDFWLVNGRYFRLKSAQAGYNFKHKLLRNFKWINKMEIALTGQNLFTWSPAFKFGLDPENGSTNQGDYPVQRTYAISLNIGF